MHGESKHKRQLFKSYLNIFCFLVDVCCFIMFHHVSSFWVNLAHPKWIRWGRWGRWGTDQRQQPHGARGQRPFHGVGDGAHHPGREAAPVGEGVVGLTQLTRRENDMWGFTKMSKWHKVTTSLTNRDHHMKCCWSLQSLLWMMKEYEIVRNT